MVGWFSTEKLLLTPVWLQSLVFQFEMKNLNLWRPEGGGNWLVSVSFVEANESQTLLFTRTILSKLACLPYIISLPVHPPTHACLSIPLHPQPFFFLLLLHPQSVPSISPPRQYPVVSISSARPPPPHEPTCFWCWLALLESICHIQIHHIFAISWSAEDSSHSPCPQSCCGPTKGKGRGAAACWRP